MVIINNRKEDLKPTVIVHTHGLDRAQVVHVLWVSEGKGYLHLRSELDFLSIVLYLFYSITLKLGPLIDVYLTKAGERLEPNDISLCSSYCPVHKSVKTKHKVTTFPDQLLQSTNISKPQKTVQ